MEKTRPSAHHLNATTLPGTAFAVLLLGAANIHEGAGLTTHTLYVLTIIAFCVQAVLAFKRA